MTAPTFAMVGHPNKGKSSLVATLARDVTVRIGPEPGTTTHARAFPLRVGVRFPAPACSSGGSSLTSQRQTGTSAARSSPKTAHVARHPRLEISHDAPW